MYPDLTRTTDDPPISVVQGTPIEDGPPACPTAAVSSAVPFGLPVYSEVQARRYEPLDQTRRADDEGTGPSGMQCFIVMLRSPVALLVALNYCVGFVLHTLIMAVCAVLLLVLQVLALPFFAVCRTAQQFRGHWSDLCTLARQRTMLAPHPLGRRAAAALAGWASGGDASFRDAMGWSRSVGCGVCYYMEDFNPYNFLFAFVPVLVLLAVPALYVYWLVCVLVPQATDEEEGLDLGGAWLLVGGGAAAAAFGGCVALAAGADDASDVACAASSTGVGAVALPALVVYVGVPLFRACEAVLAWEADNPLAATILNWSVLLVTLACACACVVSCC